MTTAQQKSALIKQRAQLRAKPKKSAADNKAIERLSAEIDKHCRLDFARIATQRTVKAINALRSIAKMGRVSGYIYTPEQIAQIGDALRAEIEALELAFEPKQASDKDVGFSL